MSVDETEFESDSISLKDEPSAYKRLMSELALADRDSERWKSDAKYTMDRYALENRDSEDARNLKSRYPLLWSNIQTLEPATYLKAPTPEVSRRHKDRNDAARVASILLERCSSYLGDRFGRHEMLKAVRTDYLIVGQGQARSFFEPTFIDEQLAYAYPFSKYVHYCDFQMSPARSWEEVRWVAFKSYMSRDELKDRFGKRAANTSLTQIPSGWDKDKDGSYIPSGLKQAEVWEFWHKYSREVYWFSPGKPDSFLDVKSDPLGLDKFFPCPKPLQATVSKNSIRPIPDYMYYKDAARDIDILTQRITALERMIRFAGVHNAAIPEIGRLATESIENRLIAASNWQLLADGGGLKGVMDILPIEEMANVLTQLYQAREVKINDVYQITGMSDVIRGQVNQNESATATSGKIQFATLRLQDRQDLMALFSRDVIEIELEIASKHLSDEMFYEIGGVQYMSPEDRETFPQALALIRNDLLNGFQIDIETDSTIATDEETQKNQAIEFLNVAGNFMDKVSLASQQMPDMVGISGEMLMFAIKSFKQGRGLESTIETWLNDTKKKIEEMQAQPPAPPPPDPAMISVQNDGQKIQMDAQAKQGELQIKSQELQIKAQELQLEARKVAVEERKVLLEEQKLQAEMQMKGLELKSKEQIALMEAQVSMSDTEGDNDVEENAKLDEILKALAALTPKVTEVNFTTDEMGNKKAVMVEKSPITNGAA